VVVTLAKRKKHTWEVGVENLRAEYERQHLLVTSAIELDPTYKRLAESFGDDPELCQLLTQMHLNSPRGRRKR